MEFKKFVILDPKQNEALMNNEIEILINLNHIVTIKPIKIMSRTEVIDGFWIRTTNGRKYRAISVPDEVIKELETETKVRKTASLDMMDESENPIQQ